MSKLQGVWTQQNAKELVLQMLKVSLTPVGVITNRKPRYKTPTRLKSAYATTQQVATSS